MKNTELLEAIGGVDARWLTDVEQAMEGKAKPRRRAKKLWRTLLLAAALTALLGVTAFASDWFGISSRLIETEDPYTRDPVSQENPVPGGWLAANGEADSPEAQASLAWERIETEARQGEHDWKAADAWEAEHPEYSAEIYLYNCFNQDMVDQLHAVAEKYGLRLHEDWVFPMTQSLFEQAAGIGDFLRGEGRWQGHYLFEDGSFKGEGVLDLEGGKLVFTLNRSKAGVLAPYGMYLRNPADYEEWQAEQDGHTLNLALREDENGFEGLILLHEGETFVTVNYGGMYVPGTPRNFDRSTAETVAACFDYDMLCSGQAQLEVINGRTAVEAEPREGLLTSIDFAQTPEYLAASRFHRAYNAWYDSRQTDPNFVRGQDWQYHYLPFPTGIEEVDEVLGELQESYGLRFPTSAEAIIGGTWIDPERLTSLMSYRVLDREHPYDEVRPEATEEDEWKLLGTEDFLRDEQSYLTTVIRWDTGAWQTMIVYGAASYELGYIPKGSFFPGLRELLHPDAGGWAYETASGEQVYIALDGEMEYPRLPVPLALYETETAYVVLEFPGMTDAVTIQTLADNIDFTKLR